MPDEQEHGMLPKVATYLRILPTSMLLAIFCLKIRERTQNCSYFVTHRVFSLRNHRFALLFDMAGIHFDMQVAYFYAEEDSELKIYILNHIFMLYHVL